MGFHPGNSLPRVKTGPIGGSLRHERCSRALSPKQKLPKVVLAWPEKISPRCFTARFDWCADQMKVARFFSRRLAVVILAIAGFVGWLGRESLLQEAANLWVVSDPLTQADAIVVLGGNYSRPPAAAELYRRGLANKVLVSHWSDFQSNCAALLQLGVPASAIEAFGTAATNTREEAVALRQWAEQNAASVFVIPTEPFTARRVQWVFRRTFYDRPVTIEVQPFDPREYSDKGWWRTETGTIEFRSEILKYLYYRWKY